MQTINALFIVYCKNPAKKFAKSMWEEGRESGYENILEIMDEINKGNDTVEKLVALGYDANIVTKVLEKK